MSLVRFPSEQTTVPVRFGAPLTHSLLFTGNYYSLRGQHERAVQYFQRAQKLNPHYLAGWTLMGHEYMEMKNTNAAIQCYRQAIGEFLATGKYRLTRRRTSGGNISLEGEHLLLSVT